jgi:predicted RND superfamily exporter protein
MQFKLTQGWTTTLNIYSQVGLVTLVGLVAKNGILIVEFANAQQEAGMTKLEAIRAAAGTRLRPILMTTVATVVGHFPLTLVTGAGAVARNSIGIVLVGGMSIGTLFTLFVVPSVYVLLAKDHHAGRRAKDEILKSDPAPPGETEGETEAAPALRGRAFNTRRRRARVRASRSRRSPGSRGGSRRGRAPATARGCARAARRAARP